MEALRVGDLILTLSGKGQAVTWIGFGGKEITRGKRCDATPVLIRKNALGANVPHRDLRITKGHSLFLDGVPVPAEYLVNNRSIEWDDRAQTVEYYHIELPRHDVLFANGAASESYRDDGNRALFLNARTAPDQGDKPPFARVLTGGARVDAIWRRLLDRAGPRPGVPVTDDPDLHLESGGARIDMATRLGDAALFRFRTGCGDVRLRSRSAVPAELGVARDPRELGVGLRHIVVRQRNRFRTINADDTRLSEGFHAFEPRARLRWTNGDAMVPDALLDGFSEEVELLVHIGGRTQYPA